MYGAEIEEAELRGNLTELGTPSRMWKPPSTDTTASLSHVHLRDPTL